MTAVFVSRLHFPVTTLGPGRRVGLWLQGCSIQCPGCISPDTWAAGRGETSVADVSGLLLSWADEADGLTVSGGEPFDQPDALSELLRIWRSASASNILVFTGYGFETVEPWLAQHPSVIDALVAGPFLKDAPQTRALRGSDNQTLHLLTTLGKAKFAAYERVANSGDQRLDIMFDADGGVWFAGIPARGDMERLRSALRDAGHQVTSAGRTAHP